MGASEELAAAARARHGFASGRNRKRLSLVSGGASGAVKRQLIAHGVGEPLVAYRKTIAAALADIHAAVPT